MPLDPFRIRVTYTLSAALALLAAFICLVFAVAGGLGDLPVLASLLSLALIILGLVTFKSSLSAVGSLLCVISLLCNIITLAVVGSLGRYPVLAILLVAPTILLLLALQHVVFVWRKRHALASRTSF